MLLVGDFDPNTWRPSEQEFRIYGDDRASVYAVVDVEDYFFFTRWKWNPTKPCPIKRRKLYLRRAVGENANGQRLRTYTVYLHVAIMQRLEPPPSPLHVLVDHKDGDSLNCRRSNLRWATISQNNRNLFGSYARQSDAFAVPGM